MKELIEIGRFDRSRHQNPVKQFTNLCQYITQDVILKWALNQTSPENRWVEIFTFFAKQVVPYQDLSRIVEYAFCLPGTNRFLERIFSAANRVWTNEKSELINTALRVSILASFIFVSVLFFKISFFFQLFNCFFFYYFFSLFGHC